ncbi:MAG: hypothetical protein AB7F28_06460 [Candidatus Margulisiibacteriota bacterium]
MDDEEPDGRYIDDLRASIVWLQKAKTESPNTHPFYTEFANPLDLLFERKYRQNCSQALRTALSERLSELQKMLPSESAILKVTSPPRTPARRVAVDAQAGTTLTPEQLQVVQAIFDAVSPDRRIDALAAASPQRPSGAALRKPPPPPPLPPPPPPSSDSVSSVSSDRDVKLACDLALGINKLNTCEQALNKVDVALDKPQPLCDFAAVILEMHQTLTALSGNDKVTSLQAYQGLTVLLQKSAETLIKRLDEDIWTIFEHSSENPKWDQLARCVMTHYKVSAFSELRTRVVEALQLKKEVWNLRPKFEQLTAYLVAGIESIAEIDSDRQEEVVISKIDRCFDMLQLCFPGDFQDEKTALSAHKARIQEALKKRLEGLEGALKLQYPFDQSPVESLCKMAEDAWQDSLTSKPLPPAHVEAFWAMIQDRKVFPVFTRAVNDAYRDESRVCDQMCRDFNGLFRGCSDPLTETDLSRVRGDFLTIQVPRTLGFYVLYEPETRWKPLLKNLVQLAVSLDFALDITPVSEELQTMRVHVLKWFAQIFPMAVMRLSRPPVSSGAVASAAKQDFDAFNRLMPKGAQQAESASQPVVAPAPGRSALMASILGFKRGEPRLADDTRAVVITDIREMCLQGLPFSIQGLLRHPELESVLPRLGELYSQCRQRYIFGIGMSYQNVLENIDTLNQEAVENGFLPVLVDLGWVEKRMGYYYPRRLVMNQSLLLSKLSDGLDFENQTIQIQQLVSVLPGKWCMEQKITVLHQLLSIVSEPVGDEQKNDKMDRVRRLLSKFPEKLSTDQLGQVEYLLSTFPEKWNEEQRCFLNILGVLSKLLDNLRKRFQPPALEFKSS